MVKTAILIGGYAKSGKSTAMTHLQQSLPTFSTSQALTKHVKLLIPYLAQFDFTSDHTKAMVFPPSTAYVTHNRLMTVLDFLGYDLDFWQAADISRDYYNRLRGKSELTIRDICIVIAESTRLIYPNIYVDLVLSQTLDHELLAIETIGGEECRYLYSALKAKGYTVIAQNIRRKTELVGVDIRELIKDAQCDRLLYDVHNNYDISFLTDYLDSLVGSIRHQQGS